VAENKRIDISMAPGVYGDSTQSGEQQRFRDCEYVRWDDGLPQKIGGYEKITLAGEPYDGVCRALHDWVSLDGQRWLALGTDQRLYLVNNETLYNITPVRDSGTLTDPFTTTAGSATVTVADTGHGLNEGDWVIFDSATVVGGLDLNGDFQVAAVVNSNTYQIAASSNAGTSATGGGTVGYIYEIPIGLQSAAEVTGYGTGLYGAGLYGVGDEVGGIERAARTWSLDNFGEDLLASPRGSSLYWWDRTLGPGSRAQLVEEAPANIEYMLVSPDARHVVCFGCDLGTAVSPQAQDKLLIRWSDAEDLFDWTPSEVNLAGDLRINTGSAIINATLTRGDIIVATDEALHALTYLANSLVFGTTLLGRLPELASPNASVDFNGVWIGLTLSEFIIYDGAIRVMSCDVGQRVFQSFNLDQQDKVYASLNEQFNEIWWFYPSAESVENDRYVVYNWEYGIWYYGTLSRSAFNDQSAFFDSPYGVEGGYLYKHEQGVDGQDSAGTPVAIPAYLETHAIQLGDADSVYAVTEMIPDFARLTGEVDLTLKARTYAQGAERTFGPIAVTSSTLKVSTRIRGRQIAYRVSVDAIGDDFRMNTWAAKFTPHGRR
jgi:hypothetical protein